MINRNCCTKTGCATAAGVVFRLNMGQNGGRKPVALIIEKRNKKCTILINLVYLGYKLFLFLKKGPTPHHHRSLPATVILKLPATTQNVDNFYCPCFALMWGLVGRERRPRFPATAFGPRTREDSARAPTSP